MNTTSSQDSPPAKETDEAHAGPTGAGESSPTQVLPEHAPMRAPETLLDSFNYDKIPIVLVAQIRPLSPQHDSEPREVWLSVQNGVNNERDTPMYRIATEAEIGPWPPCIAQLLDELRADLPKRQQRAQAKVTHSPTTTTQTGGTQSATPATASTQKKKVTPVPSKQALPLPVPTTDNPIPKAQLSMHSLFDDIEEEAGEADRAH